MTPALSELCQLMYKCAEKLEEEFKTNINEYQNNVISNKITEIELAFDKNNDFHYKEILKIIGDIMMNVKKIMYHDDFIQKLKKCEKYEPKNIEQVPPFLTLTRNGTQGVIRREKRRIASEVSLHSLEAWESYLRTKEEEKRILATERNEDVAKKIHYRYKRRTKKLVSSTFNNILEDNPRCNRESMNCSSLIREESDEESDSLNGKKSYSAEYPDDTGFSLSSSMYDLLLGPPNRMNSEGCSSDSKEKCVPKTKSPSDLPKIVNFVYKEDPH